MIIELRPKGQITVPQKILKNLGIEPGDRFDIVEQDGEIRLIPVVVYPKKYLSKTEKDLVAAIGQYDTDQKEESLPIAPEPVKTDEDLFAGLDLDNWDNKDKM